MLSLLSIFHVICCCIDVSAPYILFCGSVHEIFFSIDVKLARRGASTTTLGELGILNIKFPKGGTYVRVLQNLIPTPSSRFRPLGTYCSEFRAHLNSSCQLLLVLASHQLLLTLWCSKSGGFIH
jgi:hypothetical protein